MEMSNARESYFPKKTPKFIVPVVFRPELDMVTEEPQPYDWGIKVKFVLKDTIESTNNWLFPQVALNDFKLLCLMIDLYDALHKIAPMYFEKNSHPNREEAVQIAEISKAWIIKNGFPIFLHGFEFQITDHWNPPNLRHYFAVDMKPDKNPCIVELDRFVESLRFIVEASRLRNGFFQPFEDFDHYYHGRVELRVTADGVVYYAEDYFAAVKAQIALTQPDRFIKVCPIFGESFAAFHGRQKYCEKPTCNADKLYNDRKRKRNKLPD